MHRFVLLLATVGLTSCVTGPTAYGPAELLGTTGYRDHQIDATHYEVRFNGNARTIEARVFTYWIYRCAELTKEKGFSYFSLTDPPEKRPKAPAPPAPAKTGLSDSPSAKISDGVFCPGDRATLLATGKGGGGTTVFIPGVGGRVVTYSTDQIISLYNDPLPLQAGYVYRAQTILDAYDDYVHKPPPVALEDREAVMQRARVISPLGQAYMQFGLNLIVRLNPGQSITRYNFEQLNQPVRLRFPSAGEWTPVPQTRRFISDESVVRGQFAEISFVVATQEGDAKSNFRFDRFHFDCASLRGHRVAGGHVYLADFQPALSSLPSIRDNDVSDQPLEGEEKMAADTACKNSEGRT